MQKNALNARLYDILKGDVLRDLSILIHNSVQKKQ